ncbi:signal-transducing adaptor protein 2 isoform X2 [Spea bombifrons]|uniref:signal-transducing adaptor protein 2 isoform X2 n=1 Tax=Spea bombifrons TaxID=233779 RepID=UPI002349A15B|nr:signal-transducing adaptor protein 2 isoform X2 [Spea bombifrons]
MSRLRNPAPEHYYEEYLYKKDVNDKVYKKLWVGLLGNSLRFYSNHKDLRCVDCISLENFVSTEVPSIQTKAKSSSEFLFSLSLKDKEIHFKTQSQESREMWRAYIITMAELSIPPGLTLLPGPMLALKEALEKEKERQMQLEDTEIPSCFYHVSRMEAETLLKENPDCGNILLRPGGNQQSISVTTCQQNHSFVLKHYKVNQEQNGYVIQLEPPVICRTLAHVVNHFVKSTNNCLIPFEKHNDYENRIEVIYVNEEDGEVTVRYPQDKPVAVPITSCNGPPVLPRDRPLPEQPKKTNERQSALKMPTGGVIRANEEDGEVTVRYPQDKPVAVPIPSCIGPPLLPRDRPLHDQRKKTNERLSALNMPTGGLDEELKLKLQIRRAMVE